MDQSKLLFGLHEIHGVGWTTILKLMSGLNELKQLYIMKEHDLKALGVNPLQARKIVSELSKEGIEERLDTYRRQNIGIITIFDRNYPEMLRHSSQPPWVMYFVGDPALLRLPAVGIVGTRTPTVYGKKVAYEFASSLASSGFAVVSGLARGIDGSAHAGALGGNGATIAVLGTPIGKIYPPENRDLFRHIAEKGLILSEYPLNITMAKGMFPLRNRIIAGLSLGVVVVEAADKSGSLITAEQAFDENRDVFAVPGPITSPKSAGVLKLVKNNTASIVTAPEDIIEEYRGFINIPNPTHSIVKRSVTLLPEDERKIYVLLSSEPVTVDDLLTESQFTFGHLHSVLLSLTMKNLIQPLPGSVYIAL